MKDLPPKPKILDIGCGPGKQTLDLEKISDCEIIAIDNHKPFLDELNQEMKKQGVADRIDVRFGDMFNLDFYQESFYIVWSEGAIYNIGFEKGLASWKTYIKNDGFLAVTEVCWLKSKPLKELEDFWTENYPVMKTIEENLKIIKKTGYKLIDHFTLPESAWWNDYYIPLEKNINKFCEKYDDTPEAINLAKMEQIEIEMYRKYADYYGYVFFVMKKNLD